MRKTTVCVAAAAMALTMALAGCGSSSSTSGSTTSEASSQQEQSQPAEKAQTAEQDFSVTIDSCTQDTDYEGNPTVDITFTNNSDEAQSLATMANVEVYQDGVQRDMAISTSVDTSGYTTNVKPGVSTQATLVYSVSGTSDVEVEVYPLVSLDKTPVAQQTFALS